MIGADTLGGALLRSAAARPEALTLAWPDRRLSYAELAASARNWAKALIAQGVKPGEHVGLLLHTCPEFVEALFGIALAGAVAVPINARYQPGELAYLIENADLVALVTTGRVADTLDFAERLKVALPSLHGVWYPVALQLPEAERLKAVIAIGDPCPQGFAPAAAVLACGADVTDADLDARAAAVAPDDIALILYTSGTTSNPKGCLIAHGGMVMTARALGER